MAGEVFMAWNKLDGTRVDRNHQNNSGFPQHTKPAHWNQSQQSQIVSQQPQQIQVQQKSRFRMSIAILSAVLAFAVLFTIPEVPIVLGAVVGIILYQILKRAIPDKRMAPPLPQIEEPPHLEQVKEVERVLEEAEPQNEVEKLITDGRLYLEAIKKINRRIAKNDQNVYQQIVRMEESIEKIFNYISEHPDNAPQIRKFMNYYLPTLLKLLNSYDVLKQQRIDGEHINASITDIEGMIHTMAVAFEKQLDKLFADEAMDIASDIAVLKTMLAQEGLTEDDFKLDIKGDTIHNDRGDADNGSIQLTL